MSDTRRVRVAVVGVGAAGLAMSFALSDRLGDALDLTLFDPSFQREHRVARGGPYRTDPAEPLLNAPARMMSVRPGDDAHFTRWLERTRGAAAEQNTYVTRPTYGSYLRDAFTELRQIWDGRDGLLHCVPEEVVDLTRTSSDRYMLATRGAHYFDYDHVVLCVGWNSSDAPRATDRVSAYPLSMALERASVCGHVGIMGTGLTSVDVMRALLLSGFSGKITAASRRGILPAARNEAGALLPELYTRSALRARDRLSVRESMTLATAEAERHGVDLSVPMSVMSGANSPSQHVDYLNSALQDPWSDLFVKLGDEVACDTWNLFDASSRRAFRHTLHPYFQAWCNPVPPETARLLRDAIASGQLEVRGGLVAAENRELRYASGDTTRMHVVVDASRRGSDAIASTITPLLSNMLAKGSAVSDAFGGVQVDYGTWRVLSARGGPQRIYAVGSLTQGARYYVSALDSIVRGVGEVADAISSRIRGEAPARMVDAVRG